MKLSDSLEKIGRLNDEQKKALKKLGLFSISDLLYYTPTRYGSFSELSYIKDLNDGDQVNIYAQVKKITSRKTFKTNISITEALLEETSGDTIKTIWFSQPYISKMLKIGDNARFSGAVSVKNGKAMLSNPEFGKVNDIGLEKTGSLFADNSDDKELVIFPIYRETRKITSKWIYHKIKKILSDPEILSAIKDPIPEEILKKYKLPALKDAFFFLHLPKKKEHYEAAKKRFAFEEIFFIQLAKGIEREKYKKSGAFIIKPSKKLQNDFIKSLPFTMTNAQKSVLDEILGDFNSGEPSSRLVEGDVGSGKTIVAVAAALYAAKTKAKDQSFGTLQIAYMAPTEILARQIYKEFIKFLSPFAISVGLLTSKEARKFPSKVNKNEDTKISKAKLLSWALNGEVQILVGTHALISKKVFFENLGLVIIDEQHRFGKKQRAALRAKPIEKVEKIKNGDIKKSTKIIKKGLASNEDILPHLISMTATPIPRTLALSLYGDLDLSIIDALPEGRKKIKTEIFVDSDSQRKKVYMQCKERLDEGRQMYVICPRIDDPDPDKMQALNMKSAVSTQKEFQENPLFKDFSVGILHSKLKKDTKEKTMNDFLDNKYQILVSTSVVEVGVSVANATVMIIEGAERFGLSQLHQFRGRVARSSLQPYCYIFAKTSSEKTLQRLEAIKNAKNGFELAEYDLQFRGAGEILGSKQSGISDLAMESIKNLKMVSAARIEAQKLATNEEYKEYQNLKDRLGLVLEKIYME